MTDISAEELLQRAMAAVGRYRKVQRTVVYGQKAKVHILWEGFVEDLLQNRPSPRQRGISGGFICGDFEMSPPWFEKMEPDGTWRSCPDPRPLSNPNVNRKRR